MNNESAFPQNYRAWDDDNKEYFQSSTSGLTKIQLLTAIMLTGYISHYGFAEEGDVDKVIKLSEMILKKTEQ